MEEGCAEGVELFGAVECDLVGSAHGEMSLRRGVGRRTEAYARLGLGSEDVLVRPASGG